MMEFKDYVRLRAKYHFYLEDSDVLFRSRLSAKKFVREFLMPRKPEYMFSIRHTTNLYEEEAYQIYMYAPYTVSDDFSKIYDFYVKENEENET